jgi:hypothetical protein
VLEEEEEGEKSRTRRFNGGGEVREMREMG